MTQKKVLVVDDSRVQRELVRVALGRYGIAVVTHDGALGTGAKILTEQPDLVLLDVEMPGVQGDDLVRICRQQGVAKRVDILLYSGLPERDLIRRVERSGAAGYICKSAGIDDMVRQVRDRLRR